jgi:hypothetical protein
MAGSGSSDIERDQSLIRYLFLSHSPTMPSGGPALQVMHRLGGPARPILGRASLDCHYIGDIIFKFEANIVVFL